MENSTHREIQEKLFDKILLILAFTSVPALLASLLRFTAIGWQPVFYVHIALIVIVILIGIYRKSISYRFKTDLIIFILFILALSASLNFVDSGFMVEYLLLAVFIGAIFLGRKHSLFIYSIGSVLILIIGILSTNGVISQPVGVETYSQYFSPWLSALFGYIFLAAIVIFVAGKIGHKLSKKITELEETNRNLELANTEINKLKGIVPICSHCKKIRDSEGYWNRVESYISKHSEAEFIYGICEECLKK
jgi:MASE11